MWILLAPWLAFASPADDALNAGIAAQRADDVPKAIEHYRRCLKEEPDHVRCHWELGWSYWSRNDWAAVVEHWDRVKELSPEHPELDRWLPTAQSNLRAVADLEAARSTAKDRVRPPLPEGRTVRLRLVGDIMIGTTSPHPTAHLPPDDGATYFDAVKDLLTDADLTFGNLEGPLCDTTVVADKCKSGNPCYAFRQPTRYAKHLQAAGFTMLSIANNHMLDFGEVCRAQTIEALDGVGIVWSGPPGSVATLKVNDAKIGMIAFHTARHSNYINDHDNARELVKLAKASHDYVIVSFHGGKEGSKAYRVPDGMELFYGEKRGHLRAFSRAVVEAGADLVVGHGPHVLRGMELLDGHLVAYSLGNFATYDRFNLSGRLGVSAVLEVEIDHQGKLVRGRILPVHQPGVGIPRPDPEGQAIGMLKHLSELDFPTTAPEIAKDGTFAPR